MIKKDKIRIFLIATEQSGDNLGSDLIKHLKLGNKYKFYFYGIGGDKMIKQGLKSTNHIKEFKSIGFFEIIKNLKNIIDIMKSNVEKAIKYKPDLIITIDSPDFSFRFVNYLKKRNLKSKYIHYVAPTVWAWRPGRAKSISKLYDLLLSIFPFEKKYFEKYNLKTVFIGNPICNINKSKKNKKKEFISFLPGSRINEINTLFPYLKILSEHINTHYPNYKIFIPTLPHLKNYIKDSIKNWKNKPKFSDNINEINKFLFKSKIAIVCSGTASLELTIKKIPIIVIYKLNIFTELLFSFLVKTKYANIINIISKKEIIPELTNHNLTSKKLIKKFDVLINNDKLQQLQVKKSYAIAKTFCLKNNYAYNATREILKII